MEGRRLITLECHGGRSRRFAAAIDAGKLRFLVGGLVPALFRLAAFRLLRALAPALLPLLLLWPLLLLRRPLLRLDLAPALRAPPRLRQPFGRPGGRLSPLHRSAPRLLALPALLSAVARARLVPVRT